jgi:hypothetical protein
MRSRWVVGLVLLLGQAATVGWTQEAPAAAAVPGAKSVRLAYKYRQGAVSRMRFSSNGTIIVDISHLLPHAPGVLPSMVTADVTAQYDVIQTVKSVGAEGGATLAFTLDNLLMKADFMGAASVVARFQNGKATFTKDGERFTPPGIGSGNPFAGRSFEARVTSTGKVLRQDNRLLDALQKVFASYEELEVFQASLLLPEVRLLVLPPEATAVGASWEDEALSADVTHIAAPDGAPRAKGNLKGTNTLKEVQQRGARSIAVIDLKVEKVAAPSDDSRITGTRAANAGEPRVSIAGTHLFDVNAGELKMAEFTAKISGKDEAETLNGGPAPAVGIDATLDYKVSVLTMTAAQPSSSAASKKPRRRK